MANAFHSSYLAKRSPFWPTHFADAADRRARTRAAASRSVAPEALTVLREQNSPASVAALATGNTAVVVTGQQVGLFLGPLYTLYKAATAIVLARKLSEESGVPCVPLFWLQTEDHDFAEIASVGCVGGEVRLQTDASRVSVAQRVLGPEVAAAISALGLGERGAAVTALLERHYQPGASVAGAFAGVLTEIFAEDGLLVFNPRDARIAACARDVWRRAISEDVAIERDLETRHAALQAAGFAEQIKLRPRSPLFFLHAGDAQGPRYRLERHDDTYQMLGAEGRLTRAELLALAEKDPLRFSTSAMLRPLLQDTLLPTAAYVGGAAELDYFAQIEPLFARFGLEPPLLFHRARFRLWTPPASRAREALGLSEAECAQDAAALAARFASADANAPNAEWVREIDTRLASFAAQTTSSEQRRVALRAQRSIDYAMGRLVRQADRERAEKEDSQAARLRKLLAWMHPNGQPQERVLGFAPFAARASVADLRHAIFAALDPLDASLKEIHL